MALYIYTCPVCKLNFEVEKMMVNAGNKESCPSCHAPGERVFTAPGIAIKGSVVKSPAQCDARGGASDCAGGCCGGACSHD